MIRFKIKGQKSFEARIKAMPAAVRTEIKKSIDKTAGEIVSDMKAAAPRKTGALARSIGYTFGEYTPDNSDRKSVV